MNMQIDLDGENMKVTKEDLENVAVLSRLSVPEGKAETYIQQMVVTLDYSTMNVDQIAQAMKLNNLSLDSAKIFIAMIPVLIVYPFLQRYFVDGITLGSVKG